VSACAQGPSWHASSRAAVNYRVRSGDSVQTIAKKYRVSVQSLAEWNNLKDAHLLLPGSVVHIPPPQRSRILPGKPMPKPSTAKHIEVHQGLFDWPLDGPVISPFGIRGARRHDGVDLKASAGTPVHAAAAGVVVFNGKLSGYGNLLIVRHAGRYYSAYGHLSKFLVQKEQAIKQGQTIGLVGSTGHASGPHLHFEIRDGQQARNPLFFLASRDGSRKTAPIKEAPVVAPESAPKKHTMIAQRAPTKTESAPTRTDKWQKFVPRQKKVVQVNTPFRRQHL